MATRRKAQGPARQHSIRIDDTTWTALQKEARRRNETERPGRRLAGPIEVARDVLADWAHKGTRKKFSEFFADFRRRFPDGIGLTSEEIDRQVAGLRSKGEGDRTPWR